MTSASATLSLFGKPSSSPRRAASIVLSMFVHAALAGAIYYGITHLPRIQLCAALPSYPVRQIDLRGLDPDFPDTPVLHEPASKIPYPSPELLRRLNSDPPKQLEQQMRSFLSEAAGRQSLIQPDVRSQLSFAGQIPVPSLMIWDLEPEMRKIIEPPSQPLPALSTTRAAAAPDTATAASQLPAVAGDKPSVRTAPSATSTALRDVAGESVWAATLREHLNRAASTAMPSISDFPVPDNALLLLPAHKVAPLAGGNGRAASLSFPTASSGAAQPDDITVDGRRLSADHLLFPKGGKFSIVVVGSSLAEQYPETARIWANRIPYTAYMHVGLNKSWILQYSATREAELAGAGRVERMNAPWPYDVLRPNIEARDLHANALMVRGVLNQSGRLESLAIAAPAGFRYASFVLRMLREWQFRPALQNGRPAPVEVLLIIPEVVN